MPSCGTPPPPPRLARLRREAGVGGPAAASCSPAASTTSRPDPIFAKFAVSIQFDPFQALPQPWSHARRRLLVVALLLTLPLSAPRDKRLDLDTTNVLHSRPLPTRILVPLLRCLAFLCLGPVSPTSLGQEPRLFVFSFLSPGPPRHAPRVAPNKQERARLSPLPLPSGTDPSRPRN